MGKMRIHELATELEIKSNDIIGFLGENGIKKTASSGLEDDQIAIVRNHFKGPKAAPAKAEAPKAEAPKAEAPKADAPKAEAPKAAPATGQARPAAPAQGQPGQRPVQGQGGQRPMQGQGGPRPMQGQPGQRPMQGQPGQRPMQGQPGQRPMQGQPGQRPTQGQPGQRPAGNGGIMFVNNAAGNRQGRNQGRNQNRQVGSIDRNGVRTERPAGNRQARPVAQVDVMAAFNSALGVPNKTAEPVRPVRPAAQTPAQAPAQTAPVRQASPDPVKPEAAKTEPAKTEEVKTAAPTAPAQTEPAQTAAPAAPAKPAQASQPQQTVKSIDSIKNQFAGPRILRHEDPNASVPRRDNGNQGGNQGGNNRGGRDRNQNQGQNRDRDFNRGDDQRNARNKNGNQKNNISFSNNGSAGRGGDGRSQGQGRNARKDFGSQGGPQTFIAGPSAKNGGKGRGDRRNSDKKRDFDRDENQQLKGKKVNPHGFHKPEKVEVVEEKIKVITIPEVVTIKDLADKMKIQASEIIKKLFLQEGKMVTVNSELSYEEAENIALEHDILCEQEVKVDVIEELLKEDDESEELMINRPPVVCVMGHVDHGKTSLLDAIRKTNVTDKEAGGITQHIGAYTVTANGSPITFLDTPGHEAFTAMRMRGANSTDIAILVVAADDGVMPQTVEAINHAKAAGIEIIVAVNKIDKPNANVDRVRQELTEYELISEEWGGSTVFAEVSAKTGEGIENLLEMVLLTADILELKANPKRQARGLVIEAELDKGRGPVATVLVQKGTLHVGDFIAAGACHGKVRAMIDDKGRRVKEAGPSTPVEILGLNDVPNAGEIFVSPENDKDAKNFAETFIAQNKKKLLEDTKKAMSLDALFTKIQEGNLKELNIIVKADVQGSVEAVKTSLLKLSNEEVVVKVIHSGVGAINESDVILASASSAIIIGFNVRPDATAKNTAENEGVDVRLYKVIYQAIEDVEAAMKGMLDPVFEEKVIGHAIVRQIFKASGIGNIAGSYVIDGSFERGCQVRVTHEGEQIFEGALASLKRFKDDVKEVKTGFECGLVFEGWGDMQVDDVVEAYKMVEVPR